MEEGLPTAKINGICEGPNGFFWMASEGAGLLRYDGYEFKTYGLNRFPVVEDVVYDSISDKLFFHDGQSLWHYDGVEIQRAWRSNSSIKEIAVSEEGLFLQSQSKIWSWQNDSLIQIEELSEDASFVLWQGNLYLRSKTWFAVNHKGLESSPKPLTWSNWMESEDSVLSKDWLDFHQRGTLLYRLEGERLRLLSSGKSIAIPLDLSLRNAGPRRVFSTSNGVVVILTNEGLYILHSPWESYVPRRLPIFSIAPHNDQLFISTAMGLESLGDWKAPGGLGQGGLILTMESLGEHLYLGTEQSLVRFNPKTGQLKDLDLQGFVFSLLAHQEALWIGSSEGIWLYDQVEDVSQLLFSQDSLSGASIFKIRSAPDGSVWFASYTQGLWYHKEGQIHKYEWPPAVAGQDLSLSAFEVLPSGQLALASLKEGLFLLDPASGNHQHFDLRSLEFAEIRALISNDGALWMGTNKGLLALEDVIQNKKGQGTRLHFFGAAVGAQAIIQKGDSLIAAGDQGIHFWNIEALKGQSQNLHLALLNLNLLQEGGDSLATLSETSQAYTGLALNPRLDYDQNYLRFNYSLRGLFHPNWVQYRYRLKGQSLEWTYAGSRREALFTDLKPADYVFEVQARYPWEDWQIVAQPYSFKVTTAFWKTWWFWAFLIIAVGLLAYFWLRDRYRRAAERLRLENDLLEMERKALRLQMNPHFIFNALDSISSFIFKKDPKQAVRYLNNFAKLMRLTLESSMEHVHPVETEVSILKNYLELEKLRFSDKFDYEIEVDEDIDFDIGLPPMLIQPHVENAILHGLKPKETKGYVKISFSRDEDHLCCVIDDDGIGREKAKSIPGKKAHRSMATQINKDRIALLQKSVNEMIDLQVIDKYNQAGEATGTTVIIRLPAQEI